MAINHPPKFRILIAPDSKKRQGLAAGDIVRRQYVDGTVRRDTLMAVTDTGTQNVTDAQGVERSCPYFVGALLEGDEPREGELLDFVRMTSLRDPRRGGALYLSAADAQAPYMDVVDGAGMERSLCCPTRLAEAGVPGGKDAYVPVDTDSLAASYLMEQDGVLRICRLERPPALPPAETGCGLRQCLGQELQHPERLLVSFRVRASQPLRGALSLEDDAQRHDAATTFEVTECWGYELHVLTLEYPAGMRWLALNFESLPSGAWVELAELNVIRQSDALNLTVACKGRLGRISGIADPLFGVLNGYGAYLRNLYATDNVNIAGTLTAGDERGFGSTFYVGRIHKNVLRNSLGCDFRTATTLLPDIPPAGIGTAHRLPAGTHVLACQTAAWAAQHAGEVFCFSFWCRSATPTTLCIRQGAAPAQEVTVTTSWQRRHVLLRLQMEAAKELTLSLRTGTPVDFASPQMESGEHPTLYQATDQVLQPTDDYGAWFSRGGIGGTIQHPLLRLNDDGSLQSANGSFVVNPDGTGHFSGGRFAWSADAITLKGVTIRWEDFDHKAQAELRPKWVSICGPDTFHYADALTLVAEPATITLVGTEHNFTASERRWQYLTAAGVWQEAGSRNSVLHVAPDFHGWEQREVLTLRFVATHEEDEYTATHTVTKLFDGQSAYSVYITTDRGTVLRNGTGMTTLRAEVLRGAEPVTGLIPDERFVWTRQSDDAQGDAVWNTAQHRGATLTVQGEDVTRKAVFSCEVTL